MSTKKKNLIATDRLYLLIAGLVTTIIMVLLFIYHPQFLRILDNRIYDQLLRSHHSPKATDTPVIIDIDEKSLNDFGQWPWPRYRVAILLQNLKQLGAAAIATDIIFVEPDKTSPNILQHAWRRDLKFDFKFDGLPKGLRDNDILLADNLKNGPFVLGMDFVSQETKDSSGTLRPLDCAIKSVKVNIISPKGAPSPHEILGGMDRAICPIPVLGKAAPATGFITISADEDSLYRRAPLLISWKDNFYPSLALAALMQATGKHTLLLKMSEIGVTSIKIGNLIIPTDRQGRIRINYRGPSKSFEYISASDVLNNKITPGHLKGRIAFVGTSASGLKDIRSTPLDPGFPGVETHATIVDNILSGQFIKRPDWATSLELIAMVCAGLLTTVLLMSASAAWIALPVIGMGLSIWLGATYWYTQHQVYISPIYSLLSLLLNFSLLTIIKFWREERAKQFIHGAFAHYLAPSVISQIMEDPDALSLEGQEREVSIQFSDVRDFTSLSERLTPTQVTSLLHDYLTPMTSIITEHEGTLDKYIGDAVMAFWNAPLDIENHQKKALNAALKQLTKLDDMNSEFKEKYGFTINVGIGLHCGMVRVGNMGSIDLFDYTLIGDNVNLASRLEGLTKYYGQRLVVSESLADMCSEECHFRSLDKVRVKGRIEPVTIFTALDHEAANERLDELKAHEESYELYLNGQFAEARLGFEKLHSLGTEPILYQLYIDRCFQLEKSPPTDWDGVFTHESK